jgi:hypothetical protein
MGTIIVDTAIAAQYRRTPRYLFVAISRFVTAVPAENRLFSRQRKSSRRETGMEDYEHRFWCSQYLP